MNKRPENSAAEILYNDAKNQTSFDESTQLKPVKNYITPRGYQHLQTMLQSLLHEDRPAVIRQVALAASNGDRSENADYLYGKRKLREVEKRIRFLTQRLEKAEIVDNRWLQQPNRVFFGATVTYSENFQHQNTNNHFLSKTALSIQKKQTQSLQNNSNLDKKIIRTVTLVGIDEVNIEKNYISWVSPIAKALIKSTIGDCIQLATPDGVKELEILKIGYFENH